MPSEVERLLLEDAPSGDLTTDILGLGASRARITFTARDAMVVAGIEVAADMLAMAGLDVTLDISSGHQVASGSRLLSATGSASATHRVWKPAQTLVEILSGMATAARAVVDAARVVDPDASVACTRKTVPGARRLSQLAVTAGGAVLHRLGLSETVLIFPEHRAFLSDLPLADVLQRARSGAPEKKIAIEVNTVAEAADAITAGFDIIQLEKFTPVDVAKVVRAGPPAARPLIAAAGGIHPGNAGDYVKAGAMLLVTSWPYTARPADVSVRIGPA